MGAGAGRPVVGITADRRWEEQADLFRRRGIDTIHGPSMRTVDLSASAELRRATEALLADPPDVVVVTTGGGLRAWLAAADGWSLRAPLLGALGGARIIARGAKAASAARQAGLDVAWRAPSESMAEVVDHLRSPAAPPTEPPAATVVQSPPLGRLAIQLFDPDDHPSTVALRSLPGVTSTVEVPVYQWFPPDDPSPALALVNSAIAGDLAAVTFTSQPAVRFLFALAHTAGRRTDLVDAFASGRVLPACIGPVCAEALFAEGIPRARVLWPEPFRLPPMVRLVAERLGVTPHEPPAPPATPI